MIVSLEDRTKLKLGDALSNRLMGRANSLREGDVNPAAPACTSQFETTNFGVLHTHPNHTILSSNFSFILSHNLLTGAHLKKK